MRFSITIPDDEVSRIDEEARREGVSRSEWIHRVVHHAITAGAPGAPEAAPTGAPAPESAPEAELYEMEMMRVQLKEKDLMITELRRDKIWLQGQLALLSERVTLLLPAPKESIWNRIAFWKKTEA
ncbi:MAG TPA: CopG family transcriptional regulator [Methanomicrobiales archaeon]|nr:CopG family transcriptional regulator [Methanomicrobiales archaeon]